MSILDELPLQTKDLNIESRIKEVAGLPVALVHDREALHVLTDVLNTNDLRAPAPLRRKGGTHHAELQSFISYVNRFKEPRSIIFADPKRTDLTCVFDYHPEGGDPETAGWCGFSASYDCPTADEWDLWVGSSGRMMSSTEFAEMIDDNMVDLTSAEGFPQPVEVLEMARNLQVHIKGTFQRKVDPTTGGYVMLAKEEHAENSTKIHRAFMLALRIFQGGERYAVEARIRFQVKEGKPLFSYTLYRANDLVQDAFKAVHTQAGAETGLPVFLGRIAR